MDAPSNADQLADLLVSAGSITSPAVESAFRVVPRHLFVPGVVREFAYRDEAIPTKMVDGQAVSSASQPSIVAVMLEQLDVAPGQHVLEIGAGTGYNAALLARLVGPSGRVVTIDIDQDIVDDAGAHLAAAVVDGVDVVCGDGGLGHPDGAPYDRIIVTAGAWDIAPAWWKQLAAAGRLLVPLSLRGVQRCVAFERHGQSLTSVSVRDCGFVRLRGGFRGPETVVTAGSVTVTFDSDVDAAEVPLILTRGVAEYPLDTPASTAEVWSGLALWLALSDPGYCTVNAVWGRHEAPPLPLAATFPSGASMVGWSPASFNRSSLAVLRLGPGGLAVHAYGEGAETAARLADNVAHWDAAGRPDSQSLALRVHLESEPIPDIDGLVKIDKQRTTIVIEWPGSPT